MTTIVRRLLFFIALIAIWEIIYRIDLFSTRMFPSPLLSFVELYRGFFETGILTAALTTSMG
ncbi:ABC transporter permease, partial [Flavobacterium sp. IR1]